MNSVSSFHKYPLLLFVLTKNLKIKIFVMIILLVADVRKYERKTTSNITGIFG
jgi:hypothetical protein